MVPLTILLVAASFYAVGDAILAPAPLSADPGFLETLVASRAVVAAVRVAVIFAAAFVVVSVVALISARRWPTKIGPVEIAGEVPKLDTESERLKSAMEEYIATIEELRDEVPVNPEERPGSDDPAGRDRSTTC
jgi:hypothetical protein